MTTEELEILAKQGEGYTLEFKENLGKKFVVEVVAFANSMGGKILIGVDDDGNIIGTDTSNNQRANIQNQISQIEPRINVKIEVVDNVIVVNVPEGDDKPYSSSDGYYLRAGAMCQKMNRNEIREYLEDGGKISQETRRFNPLTSETSTMRSKEDAIDYRYFPDPDLAPLIITQELIDSIKKAIQFFKNKIGTNYSYFYSLLKDSTGSFLLANFAGIKPAIIVNITLIMISIIAPFSGN